MSLQSLNYLLFLAGVAGVYWLMGRRLQNWWLLAVSLWFYGAVHPALLGLLAAMTAGAFFPALAMERWPGRQKAWFLAGTVVCLGLLGVFKYYGFFVANLAALLGWLGLSFQAPVLDLLLPLGISFYTFRAVAYLADVQAGKLAARRHLGEFGLFMAFFPQLVAGPIERAGHFLPQIEAPRQLTAEHLRRALYLLVWGLFKKLVIADNVGIMVDKVFSLAEPGLGLLLVGAFGYAIQIYADFSALTDLARGSGHLLGFETLPNFRHPYLADSVGDFWRRWHMTMSYWFRDYVYIPLGGSRRGEGRNAWNVMVTFLLSGLWHGAGWNFVLWGGYHGLLVLAGRWKHRWGLAPAAPGPWRRAWQVAVTFVLVSLGWLLFRESDLAWLARQFAGPVWPASAGGGLVALYLFWNMLLYSLPLWLHPVWDAWRRRAADQGPGAGWGPELAGLAALSLMFLGVLILQSPAPSTFIYAQF
ncbi:MAG: MBOAT family protein [Deltaproteobacteria bacterium]|nr:MBOAT family protein [Deltaproteobacteria bacterium]